MLATPEKEPLAALGGGVPEFLTESCAEAGVEMHTGFEVASYEEGEIRASRGDSLGYDLALVVPPHVHSTLLAHLPEDGPLVEVSPRFESAEEGLFVVGDAAAGSPPRAADAALVRLVPEEEPHVPEPECFVGHGGGIFSRISLRFPEGLPPEGAAEVTLEGSSHDLAGTKQAAGGKSRERSIPFVLQSDLAAEEPVDEDEIHGGERHPDRHAVLGGRGVLDREAIFGVHGGQDVRIHREDRAGQHPHDAGARREERRPVPPHEVEVDYPYEPGYGDERQHVSGRGAR